MLVLHFSLTPLAGSPIRICRALNLIEGIQARLVLLDPKGYMDRAYPADLTWETDKEKVIDLANRADIFHFHNYVHLDSKEFLPLDFQNMWKGGKGIVRHFHSNPELIARMTRMQVNEVELCPLPKLTLAQYHERYYPSAKLVPNIVFDIEEFDPRSRSKDGITIGYSPSSFCPSRASRWETKGYPETIRVLKRFERKAKKRGLDVNVDIIEQVAHAECLRRKAACDIAIDELVTGSYHMSTLESLALGSAVLTFMDDRILKAVKNVCGRDDFPVINTALEDLESTLMYLVERPELMRQIGLDSSNWMKEYWRPENMAMKFVDIYKEVTENPHESFPERFSLQAQSDRFLYRDVYDERWKARHERWPKEMPLVFKKIKSSVGRVLKKVGLKK